MKTVGIEVRGRWEFWGLGGHGRVPLLAAWPARCRRWSAAGGTRLCVATATVAGRRGGGWESALLYYMCGVRWFSTGTGGA